MVEQFYRASLTLYSADVTARFETFEQTNCGTNGLETERVLYFRARWRVTLDENAVLNEAQAFQHFRCQPHPRHQLPPDALADAFERLPRALKDALLRLQRVRKCEP